MSASTPAVAIRDATWGLTLDVSSKAAAFTIAAQVEGYREAAAGAWSVTVYGLTLDVYAADHERADARAAVERACSALRYTLTGRR